MSVFISYSSKDEEYTSRLKEALRLNKIPCWYAPHDIGVGENFVQKISNELKNDSYNDSFENIKKNCEQLKLNKTQLFLLVLSANSMHSEWVERELVMAVNNHIPIMAVQIDNSLLIGNFEYILSTVQIIKSYHFEKNGLETVIKEISSRVGIEVLDDDNYSKRLSYSEIGIYPIAEGDPFYTEGRTFFVELSDYSFKLSPPDDALEKSVSVDYLRSHTFNLKDDVFGMTLEEVCEKINIVDLYEMINESKKKIFDDFLSQNNGCYYNNNKYGIYSLSTYERTEDIAEEPVLRIKMYITDYFTHRVMKDVCKKINKKSNYFKNVNYNSIGYNCIFFTSLGVNLILSDKSGNLLITGRATNASETYGSHNYSVSVIEGVSQSDYDCYNRNVNIKFAIKRGLEEELGVNERFLEEDSLKIYDLFVNPINQEFGFSCSYDLKPEYDMTRNIISLKGKDDKLEIAEKKVIPKLELKKFIYNNRYAILPQAVYTMLIYLESQGIFLIDRYHRVPKKNEEFVMSKSGKLNERCGDAYIITENYIGVIDGATPKGTRLWNGEKGDVFISHLIAKSIEHMDKDYEASEAINYLNNIVKSMYEQENLEFSTMKSEERLQCSLIIYSVSKKEVWSFGDCMLKINDKEFHNIKEVDMLLSNLRSLYVQLLKSENNELSDEMLSDMSRERILPLLKRCTFFANKNVPYGYDVIDGGKINPEHVKVYAVQKGDHVVLASDGYPKLFDTLEDTESYLLKALAQDPLCINTLCGTKGVAKGNVSYDDRTYVSFSIV